MVILVFFRRRSVGDLLTYALIVFAGYLLLPLLVSNANQLFSVRFQLAFFVLWSPVIAEALNLIDRRWLSLSVAFGFLLVALPVMLFNNTRPIIGRTPWMTKIDSVFTVPQEDIAFVSYLNLRDPIGDVADHLSASGCQRVELRIDSSDPEYLFWWTIKPLDNQIMVQSTYVDPSVEGLLDREFNPCAVVCTTCSNIDEYNGMPLTGDFGNVRIFGASP
jgi:hypothetical protein